MSNNDDDNNGIVDDIKDNTRLLHIKFIHGTNIKILFQFHEKCAFVYAKNLGLM